MTLAVEPAVLRSAGAAFEQSVNDLADLQAQTPLNDAAATVPSLTTAGACRVAASERAAEVPPERPGGAAGRVATSRRPSTPYAQPWSWRGDH